PQNIGITSSLSMISDSGKTSSSLPVAGFWQKYLISCLLATRFMAPRLITLAGEKRKEIITPRAEKPATARAGRARGEKVTLLGHRVRPFAVLAFGGCHLEPHLGAQRATDEAADAVGLPAGGLHQFG